MNKIAVGSVSHPFKKTGKQQSREKRLAAALRENLRKRKKIKPKL